MTKQIESGPVFTSKVPFEFFERAFTGPYGEGKEGSGVYSGEPPRILSKIFGAGRVRIHRHEQGLELHITEELGENGDWALYSLVLGRDGKVKMPRQLGFGPFCSESFLNRRLPIPPEPDQAKIDDLIVSAQRTVSLHR